MPYGTTLWVRPDVQQPKAVRKGLAELLLGDDGEQGVFVVIDIPINAQDGLDDPEALAPADLLAFEIATASKPDLSVWHDGGRYELLGVEFFESDPGTSQLAGATIFRSSEEVNCGEIIDCNQNEVDDAVDIAEETSFDCNINGVPDECDIASGYSQDTNENGIPDECDPE
jgi:hypothetical protein